MFSKKKPVFLLLGRGGHREDGSGLDADRGFIIFVQARDLKHARREATDALHERNWHGVEPLRAGEVGERPTQEPHGSAWAEAREGRWGIVVCSVANSGEAAPLAAGSASEGQA